MVMVSRFDTGNKVNEETGALNVLDGRSYTDGYKFLLC